MATGLIFSVIIPVYNDAERLRECLRAIAAQSMDVNALEVVVVDNGSSNPLDALVGEYRFARLIHEPLAGSYRARNAGVREARGSYLAFTDSDCRPHPRWLENALAYFEQHPDVAAIGGGIELASGDPPSPAEIYEQVFAFHQQRYVHQYGFGATANLLVRREVFDQVGPFDARMKTGGDRHWGQRMWLAGYRMDYVPNASITHPARSRIRELIHKRRRLTATAAVQVPTLSQLLPDIVERPYKTLPRGSERLRAMLCTPSELGLTRFQGWQLFGVVLILDAIGYCERLRLRLGGVPVR